MVKKKTRLGRGLGALLGDMQSATEMQPASATGHRGRDGVSASAGGDRAGFREIPIEQLQRGEYQPRVRMDKEALVELGNSIRSQGVLQPLLVRPKGKDCYEIIAGERRWRGAQLAGLQTVPAVIREVEDRTAMAVGLIENIQRENLNAVEQARGYHRLLDEFGLTHQEASDAVGCSRATITNLLRLLSLHPEVQKMLEEGRLDMGHARALLGLTEADQPRAAETVSNKKLSVRQTEQLVKSINRPVVHDNAKGRQATADIRLLEEDLSKKLGAKVDIRHGAKKGKLIIHYHSLDELDGILEKIK